MNSMDEIKTNKLLDKLFQADILLADAGFVTYGVRAEIDRARDAIRDGHARLQAIHDEERKDAAKTQEQIEEGFKAPSKIKEWADTQANHRKRGGDGQ